AMSLCSNLVYGRATSRRRLPFGRCRLFEMLEDRRLLACNVFVDDQTRTLLVKGDDLDNTIAVRRDSTETLALYCDGATTRVKLTRIGEVQVKAGGGNDMVTTEPI